ncbi:MAG: response regulator, partial [Bacteroidales bacterium]|nr:response regulator [Bacteroidales bacterium]
FDDIIDVDMPFKRSEVEKRTSKEYVETLSRSDIPLTQKKKSSKTAYCEKGDRMCRRPVIEGKECAGECPIVKKERENAKKYASVASISKDMIDVDIPFNIQDVERVTGTDYISCLDRSDIPRVALYGRNTFVKHSVLVVDDEPIVCHSLRKILNKQSCAVEEAFDVDAALEKMKLNKYDLVFLDLKMPKTSGMELLKSLKEQYPDVPVVMITGYASIDKAVEATRLGAFQFIPKPFTPDELKQVTTEALAA